VSNLIEVLNQDGQLVVTSRQIAEDFEKEHKHVLDSIRNLVAENPAVKNMIIESSYENRGKQYPEYLLTRDGFSLLVMGFTGAKALEWKIKYIEAFNKMEEQLKNPYQNLSKELQAVFILDKKTQEIENRVDNLESNMPLFNVDCKELQALVRKVGMKVLDGYKSPAYNDNSLRGKMYADIQHQLKREFGVNRYEAIKRSQLETAKRIIEEYKAPTVLASEIQIANNQISYQEVACGK
jgi:Rha family phage regulatory protein